jgi:hypothetical protein
VTVANIVARAKSLANVTGSSVFSDTESTDSLNASYRDLYEQCVNADDDYFLTDWTFTLSSMTVVTNDPNAYTIALPATFYRLRLLEYQIGQRWRPISKASMQDEYKRATGPQYRLKGSYLLVMFPAAGGYSNFRAWYYPTPTAYSVSSGGSTDIATPPQLEVDILAYQIAIDIKRKQSADYSQLEARRNELWSRFLAAVNRRDDWDVQRVANVYATTTGAT